MVGADEVLDVGQLIAGGFARARGLHGQGEIDRDRGCRVLVGRGIAAEAAVKNVLVEAAFENIITIQPAQCVIARATHEEVRLRVADDLIVRLAADHVPDAADPGRARGRSVGTHGVRNGKVDRDRRCPV